EVEGVALLAPGRTGLELGAVGHFDVDHVIVGVATGLHVHFPWVSHWFPTSGSKLSGASTGRGLNLQLKRAAAVPLSTGGPAFRQSRSRRTAMQRRRALPQPCSGRTEPPRRSMMPG